MHLFTIMALVTLRILEVVDILGMSYKGIFKPFLAIFLLLNWIFLMVCLQAIDMETVSSLTGFYF